MATAAKGTRSSNDLDTSVPAPRWPAIVGTLLCVAGLGVAAYLTYAHYNTHIQLACPDKGIINCAKVTSSSYSHFLGVPVALLGLLFFAFMLPLQLPVAWRSTNPLLRQARVVATVGSMVFVIYLVFAELIRIRNICLYCTAVHVLSFLLFVSTVMGTIATAPLAIDQATD